MELPEDVLAIVREYSRPRFKYFREYKRAVQVLGKDKWHPLKDKLQSHGEKIIPILLPYLEAYIETKMRRQAVLDLVNSLPFMERERHIELVWVSRKIEDDLYRTLVKEVYGVRLPISELYVEQS